MLSSLSSRVLLYSTGLQSLLIFPLGDTSLLPPRTFSLLEWLLSILVSPLSFFLRNSAWSFPPSPSPPLLISPVCPETCDSILMLADDNLYGLTFVQTSLIFVPGLLTPMKDHIARRKPRRLRETDQIHIHSPYSWNITADSGTMPRYSLKYPKTDWE